MLARKFARRTAIAIAVLVAVAAIAFGSARTTTNHKASPKLVDLVFTFSDGGWAEVHSVEGQMITIKENGKTLGIIPYIRSLAAKQVELGVFRIDDNSGSETVTRVATCSLSEAPATLKGVISPVSVQFKEFETTSASTSSRCCATDCTGRVLCGFCVCTPCGACGPCLCVPL